MNDNNIYCMQVLIWFCVWCSFVMKNCMKSVYFLQKNPFIWPLGHIESQFFLKKSFRCSEWKMQRKYRPNMYDRDFIFSFDTEKVFDRYEMVSNRFHEGLLLVCYWNFVVKNNWYWMCFAATILHWLRQMNRKMKVISH